MWASRMYSPPSPQTFVYTRPSPKFQIPRNNPEWSKHTYDWIKTLRTTKMYRLRGEHYFENSLADEKTAPRCLATSLEY